MPDALNMYVGNRLPLLTDVITVNGSPDDLTGATVKLKMRAEATGVLTIDAAATITDAPGGAVQYAWAAVDVDTPGEYLAWWEVTKSGLTQDTPEFTVNILAHTDAPGSLHLCSIADYREQTEQTNTRTTSDELLFAMIEAASSSIQQRFHREFLSGFTGARRFTLDGWTLHLGKYDLHADPTAVTLHPETASPVTLVEYEDYMFLTKTGPQAYRTLILDRSLDIRGDTYRRFGHSVIDVASTDWGLFASQSTVPSDVRRACVLTVASWLDRSIGEYAVTEFSESGGGYRPNTFTGWPIPSAARLLLQNYESPVVI